MRIIRAADCKVMPWKNGGGTTREVAAWPPGASVQDFDWRISVATIAADGPFSAFAGIDRVITLLAGDGVLLQGAGWSHALDEALAPFAFAGDEPVQATLLGGASEDFNVMTRRGRCQAQVRVVRTAQPIAGQYRADRAAGRARHVVGGIEDTGTPGAAGRAKTISCGPASDVFKPNRAYVGVNKRGIAIK